MNTDEWEVQNNLLGDSSEWQAASTISARHVSEVPSQKKPWFLKELPRKTRVLHE